MTIWTTLQDFQPDETPTFAHIKGHQDKHKRYHELSLPAQLNVDAARLANEFIHDHPDIDYGHVLQMPQAKVQLCFPTGTATYKLKRKTHLARNAPPLEEKLKD